ncbi:transposase [Siminovitchia sp. FSL H7-0308]|uniref:Transposase DDE domain-containing protein n=1 Tax=Siminovitchia thermophila TaxID=1245522 RepID=A0ABS2RAI8_9BACI|nr:transposase [Siminovitchia thermophila]MBM7716609.1 hypothetical protein [Siminovitchia thermophila]ONK22943.1 hypothetical protein BLX87_13445 [Bacillus sp. VT-16-64]
MTKQTLNMIYEEMKAKAKTALECEEIAEIYSRRKNEIESVFGHIKGNRSFRRFSLRGLKKVHVAFGIVALAHNFLNVAGIRQLLSGGDPKNTKSGERKQTVFLRLIYFRGFLDSPFLLFFIYLCPSLRYKHLILLAGGLPDSQEVF